MTSGFSLLRILKILLGTYELDHLMRQIVPQETGVACEDGNPLRLILSLILAWVKFRSAAARAKLRLNSAGTELWFLFGAWQGDDTVMWFRKEGDRWERCLIISYISYCILKISFGCGPLPVTVTTKLTFSAGDPYRTFIYHWNPGRGATPKIRFTQGIDQVDSSPLQCLHSMCRMGMKDNLSRS